MTPRRAGLGPGHEVALRAVEGVRDETRIVIVEDRDEVELRFARNTATTNGLRHARHVTVIS
ncbi:MAG: TldD/PmbA family protein, partial [Acidimicrobiales bacterium]